MRPPHNVAYLEKALRALAKTDDSIVRLRRTLANVIAGQFLEGGCHARGRVAETALWRTGNAIHA